MLGGLLAVLGFTWTVNSHGHYRLAAVLTVVWSVGGPWLSVLLDPAVLKGDFVPLVYVGLSVMLCAILLGERLTAALAALQFVALLLLDRFYPISPGLNWPSLLAYYVFVSTLSILSNVMFRADLRQIDRQNSQLRGARPSCAIFRCATR